MKYTPDGHTILTMLIALHDAAGWESAPGQPVLFGKLSAWAGESAAMSKRRAIDPGIDSASVILQ